MAVPHLNGSDWPELPREPITMPEIPARPTPLELARAYASIVVAWRALWVKVVDALNWLHGVWLQLDGRLERIERVLSRIAAQPGRLQLPSLNEYSPEQTAGGGIKVSAEAWQAVQLRIAQIDVERARAEGAEAARAAIERESDKRLQRLAKWIKILSPLILAIGGAIGFLIRHFVSK